MAPTTGSHACQTRSASTIKQRIMNPSSQPGSSPVSGKAAVDSTATTSGNGAIQAAPTAAAWQPSTLTGPGPRRPSRAVDIDGVRVGGSAPVVVQSMTNTDTADIAGTTRQVAELWRAGSELVRLTVNTPEAAAAVPRIRERLEMMGVTVPLVGDFHYNGHQLLSAEPACARALAKYRINPGNVGFGHKRDHQFATIIELAMEYGKAVRIGANWGSLDQALAARLMDENAASAQPQEP